MTTASATQTADPEPPAAERTRWPARARATARRFYVDAAAGTLAVVLLFALHNIYVMMKANYWLDEAWVAASVRLPLSDLPLATSSTPSAGRSCCASCRTSTTCGSSRSPSWWPRSSSRMPWGARLAFRTAGRVSSPGWPRRPA
ncbi:hypothetical protein ACFQ1L_26625 [Phytohabitans flavus]|uniref:hypothetical protein n=1 Tax=Phytohabitans flavus TaxID=1076124 RepID=UPI0036405339